METPHFSFNRQRLIQIFFFLAFGFLLYQLFLLARPFLPAFLGAVMLAMGFYPLHLRVKKRVRHPNMAAIVMTAVVSLLTILPLVACCYMLLSEAGRLLPAIQGTIGLLRSGDYLTAKQTLPPTVQLWVDHATVYLLKMGINLKPLILENIQPVVESILEWGRLTASHLIIILFNGVVLVVVLFFAFRDGEALADWCLSLIPLEAEHKQILARRAYETFRAVAVGVALTALAQGLVAMLGFWVAGVTVPVFLGFVTVVASFIGLSFLITVPVAIVRMGASPGWGWFLLIWGTVGLGIIDSLLKPMLIGSRARMPFILILFSIVGGFKAYGILGFVLGPVVVASILTFVKIYREQFNPDSGGAEKAKLESSL